MRAIIVFYDSLNRRYLPPYNPACGTIAPNFTRLARRTAVFQNSFVGSMPCIPARRELHTGRYNFLHREWGPLEPFDDSMPELLKNQGIYTHLISDHLHYWEDGGADYHTRYSSWEAVRGQEGDHWKGQVDSPHIPPVVKVPQKQTGGGESGLWRYDWVNRQYIVEERDFPQTKCFDRGCEFIEHNKNSDHWLLHLETFDPHEPFYAPKEYKALYPEHYQGAHFDWPRGAVEESEEAIAHCRCQYQAVVSMCDHNLGRILDLMDRYDMWKDTMLIVGTDHGFLLAEHQYWGKNQMPYYNEIANTPLFIWDPRSRIKGEKRQALVQMIDWAPTLLSYFGKKVPGGMQGHDLADTIRSDKRVRDYAIFGVFSGHVNITDGSYVYMRAPLPKKANDIYNYTLMPLHMNQRFTVGELRTAQLTEPFSFTKGCRLLKIKAKDKFKVGRFGTLLFDIRTDPEERYPVKDSETEKRMCKAMIEEMRKNDSPKEQFERLGLHKEEDGQ
ncbi:sulfatase [Clostridium porci]|uniref:Sulfatase n=1 Tax=Clostridium porci TaxID=2605778 RepID=A0A7X2NLR4_9CLOT|nr:sulfatase [Clostridium porci]MSS37215.1 sulfatase [Clostridium porci]